MTVQFILANPLTADSLTVHKTAMLRAPPPAKTPTTRQSTVQHSAVKYDLTRRLIQIQYTSGRNTVQHSVAGYRLQTATNMGSLEHTAWNIQITLQCSGVCTKRGV